MDPVNVSARPDVTLATTAPRVTPTTRTNFKEVLSRSLVSSAEAAMKILPGSPLMAVAVRGASGSASALGVPMSGIGSPSRIMSASPEGPQVGAAASGTSLGIGGVGAGTGTGTGVAGEAGGVDASLAQSQDMNLYYLQLQEQVNSQNRSFTALSNVLKAQHDTVKNAIGNLR